MKTPIIQKPSQSSYVSMLIFGDAGIGKTTLLGSTQQDPRTAPTLILDFEGGLSSLVGLDVDVVRIKDFEEYDEICSYLESADHGYKSVCVDSLTEVHMLAILHYTEPGIGGRDNRLDYGRALMEMRRIIRRFNDLPLHFFATALTQEKVVAKLGPVTMPHLSGVFATEGPALFGTVGYLTYTSSDDEAQRVLYLKNQPNIRCKVRSPWGVAAEEIPDGILQPTIGKLLDVLKSPMPESKAVRKGGGS